MKRSCSSLLLCMAFSLPLILQAQTENDSLQNDSLLPARDTIPLRLRFNGIGAHAYKGNAQYFDGYNHEVMYLNALSGLSLYSDWAVYSSLGQDPVYYGACLQATWADSLKKTRVRVGLQYFYRKDSMAYRSGFAVNDTIYGRDGNEVSYYLGISAAALKSTKVLFGFFRPYCGAELEVDLAGSSQIRLIEFAYDFGEQRIIELNEFDARGRMRLNFFGGAVLGTEFLMARRASLYAEVRSGIGMHWIPGERPIGISRNNWALGFCYYFSRQ